MSKELYFTDGNNEVKYLDTTASFNLAITQDGSAFDLTNATAIDVKVANDTGYVFDKSIDMATIKQPLAGLITMPVDAEVMNALVPDDYTIEVWVTLSSLITPGSQEGLTDTGTTTSSTGTTTYNAIFPSDDPQGFTITENVMSDSGDVIPVMSLDTFQQEFDQLKTDLTNKVATLQGPKGDKGDKGDTGTVDNTGLISAPAFQSLQTQVDNSAVGTNLLLGTSGPFTMWYGALNTVWNADKKRSEISLPTTVSSTEVLPKDPGFFLNVTPGIPYTQSIYVSTDAPLTGKAVQVSWFTTTYGHNTNGKDDISSISKNVYRITSTQTWPASSTDVNIRAFDLFNLGFVFDFAKGTFLYFYQPKIELGSHATDWCPNPSEILTQSDYAKIKAAIVALGGALS